MYLFTHLQWPHMPCIHFVYPWFILHPPRGYHNDYNTKNKCLHWSSVSINIRLFLVCSGHRGRPNRWGPERDDGQVFTWRLSISDALQTFLIFDHRFEALVGCACSRIAGESGSSKWRWGDERNWDEAGWREEEEEVEERCGERMMWLGEKTKIFFVGLLAILQTYPNFNHCGAARCWDGSVSQSLLTEMKDKHVITSWPSSFRLFLSRSAVSNKTLRQ